MGREGVTDLRRDRKIGESFSPGCVSSDWTNEVLLVFSLKSGDLYEERRYKEASCHGHSSVMK